MTIDIVGFTIAVEPHDPKMNLDFGLISKVSGVLHILYKDQNE